MVIPPEKRIQLTQGGDILVMPRGRKETDTLPLAPDDIGWHEQDDGYIGLEQGPDATHEMVCWVCHKLHVTVPNTVTTYAQLRAFLQKELQAPQ